MSVCTACGDKITTDVINIFTEEAEDLCSECLDGGGTPMSDDEWDADVLEYLSDGE